MRRKEKKLNRMPIPRHNAITYGPEGSALRERLNSPNSGPAFLYGEYSSAASIGSLTSQADFLVDPPVG